MTKPAKIAVAVLLSGTLLTGIGAGVAFAEYSSFRYETVEAPNAAEPITLTKTYAIPEDCKVRVDGTNCTVTPDESVPVNTVSITATSLKQVEGVEIEGPFLEEETTYEYSDYSDTTEPKVEKVARFYTRLIEDNSGMSDFKDQVLNGLKEGVLYDYEGVYVGFSVELKMNPADVHRVFQ